MRFRYPAPVTPPTAPRRSPAPEDRRQDPERTRRALLDAAHDVFSEKGYAGARVQDIADRAGVNKQLISYHFGGKEGLYRALRDRWLAREEEFADPSLPLDELVLRYLTAALDDPRGARLALWRALTERPDAVPPGPPEDLAALRRRQAEGEIAPEFDPGLIMIMLHALVTAPIAHAPTIRTVTGLDPAGPEFRARYAGQLRALLRRLGG
ncbi:TetR family transcriptional regulator [Actinomadura rayongensis]|uniref:TetR family transcriptional regulator n=1 Tax=Actinomadura rayongensis TaxID=1429076 RepID=A0A6I4W6P5_9ACTN|nr:TetR family transcriptional regulator [Actinomadura rayongensis]MXQ62814.1 TetR family transcriptional regulator [Actinomadura rayongensis]